jgi:hypothetical protein
MRARRHGRNNHPGLIQQAVALPCCRATRKRSILVTCNIQMSVRDRSRMAICTSVIRRGNILSEALSTKRKNIHKAPVAHPKFRSRLWPCLPFLPSLLEKGLPRCQCSIDNVLSFANCLYPSFRSPLSGPSHTASSHHRKPGGRLETEWTSSH